MKRQEGVHSIAGDSGGEEDALGERLSEGVEEEGEWGSGVWEEKGDELRTLADSG